MTRKYIPAKEEVTIEELKQWISDHAMPCLLKAQERLEYDESRSCPHVTATTLLIRNAIRFCPLKDVTQK